MNTDATIIWAEPVQRLAESLQRHDLSPMEATAEAIRLSCRPKLKPEAWTLPSQRKYLSREATR